MRLIKPEKVTETQLREIAELVQVCGRHDKIEYSFYIDESFKAPDDLNTFMLYEDVHADKHKCGRLISFIDLFIPGKKEAEVTAFTCPEFRRKGCFKALLMEAKAEITKRGIPDFLFLCDEKSADGQAVIRHIGGVYEFSEYLMRYDKNRKPEPGRSLLEIKPAEQKEKKDREDLISLSRFSFSESGVDAESYLDSVMSSENRSIHAGFFEGRIAGMISAAREGGKSYIHGLYVDPDLRGRGFGRELLDYKVRESLDFDPKLEIELEVMTENRGALSLYQKAGFSIQSCCNYFRKMAAEIQ